MKDRWVCPLCCHVNTTYGLFSGEGYCQGDTCAARRSFRAVMARLFGEPPPQHMPEILAAEYRGAEA